MIIPFINFAGQATEAIAFYETVFDIRDKQVSLYKDLAAYDAQAPTFPAEIENYVLHSEMNICGTKVWMGDSPEGGVTSGNMVSLSVTFATIEEVQQAFEKLKAGGEILIELEPQFYSPMYGMLKDKFGVVWSLICE